MRVTRGFWSAALALAGLVVLVTGCGRGAETSGSHVHWLAVGPVPAPDPGGTPDEVRWAIERLLTRGLVDEMADGRIVPMLAESVVVSPDARTYRFVLRRGLGYPDGSRISSADVRDALLRGLERRDHALHRWVLRSVEGVSSIRPGRPLPALGIDVPDSATLVLRLARPDSLLLPGLALPGISAPVRFAAAEPAWSGFAGAGPYRVLPNSAGPSLTLVRRPAPLLPVVAGPDTIRIRFATGVRLRAILRSGTMDVVWPLPLGDPVRSDTLQGYRWAQRPAAWLRPARTVALVLRADVAPTAKLAARRALAHSFNAEELRRTLGDGVEPFISFWPAAGPFDVPRLDAQRTLEWLAQGRLGRSFHTTLVFDPDEIHERAARRLQIQWARADLSVDVRPLRGERLWRERMEGRAQILLLVSRPPVAVPDGELAVMTRFDREKPVAAYRSGWSANEFRAWIRGDRPFAAGDRAEAQDAIETATVVLPVGRAGWSWIERAGAPARPFHPHFGLDLAGAGVPGHPVP